MKLTGKIACGMLVASMALAPLQVLHADMIAVQPVLEQPDREGLTSRLQALGVPQRFARERVAALTDTEAAALAGQIDALPAGGNAVFAFLALMLFFAFVVDQTLDAK